MTKPKRDWPRILADLRQAGFFTYKVAVKCDAKWDSVKNWENGIGEPRYSTGVCILELYREVIGRTAGAEKAAAAES